MLAVAADFVGGRGVRRDVKLAVRMKELLAFWRPGRLWTGVRGDDDACLSYHGPWHVGARLNTYTQTALDMGVRW